MQPGWVGKGRQVALALQKVKVNATSSIIMTDGRQKP